MASLVQHATRHLMQAAALAMLTIGCRPQLGHAERAASAPDGAPVTASQEKHAVQKATFAAGCFWGVEHAFRQVEGVTATRVGYTGGNLPNPTYTQVCRGGTGHAEAVEVTFDPALVTYDTLLATFFSIHNPTIDNPDPDQSSQYGSAIFVHAPEQEAAARTAIGQLSASGKYVRPVHTRVLPATTFYPAEAYHQQYYAKQGRTTCARTIER